MTTKNTIRKTESKGSFANCFSTLLPDGRKPKGMILMKAVEEYRPEFARVDMSAVQSLEKPTAGFGIPSGWNMLPPSMRNSPEAATVFLLALGSLNFMFWKKTPAGLSRYEWRGIVGAPGMFAAFAEAWGNDTSPKFPVPLCSEDIVRMFGDIPDLTSRMECLNDVLTRPEVLSRIRTTLVTRARQSRPLTQLDAELLSREFPIAYGDDPFFKKAQFILSMLAGTYSDFGMRVGVDLTAFADYRVPQVLRSLGVLKVNKVLSDKVACGEYLFSDTEEERALRAAALLAVRKLAEHWGVSEAEADFLLWSLRDEASVPFHLTPGTNY